MKLVTLATIMTNKGIKAGGANTNNNGLAFEKLTSNYNNLMSLGFEKIQMSVKSKNSYYLYKKHQNVNVYYTEKIGLKHLLLEKYNKIIHKQPDEAYLIEGINCLPTLVILEKKFQNVHGSVDEKLLACDGIRKMYRNVLDGHVNVEYMLCLSDFYKKLFEVEPSDKYKLIKGIINQFNVPVLYGNDSDYIEKLNRILENEYLKTSSSKPNESVSDRVEN